GVGEGGAKKELRQGEEWRGSATYPPRILDDSKEIRHRQRETSATRLRVCCAAPHLSLSCRRAEGDAACKQRGASTQSDDAALPFPPEGGRHRACAIRF